MIGLMTNRHRLSGFVSTRFGNLRSGVAWHWLTPVAASGKRILAAAMLGLACAEAQPTPDPAQGAIDGSGKFIPTTKAEGSKAPLTPESLQKQAAELIEKTGETTFRIGRVQCDRATKTISFPAKINSREGLVEYALVTTKGKVHEALLATEVSPLHLHLAALLLGMAPQGETPKPMPISIEVEWATNGPAKRLPLEELVTLAHESPQGKTGSTLARGPWHYQGSMLDAGGFVAERDGSIIALISDSTALAGNPRARGNDDTLHVPNTALLPAKETPVTVSLRPIAPTP